MKTTIKLFIHKFTYGDQYLAFSSNMSNSTFVFVGETEFEYEIPENFNESAARIAVLRGKVEEETEQFHKRIADLKSQITDLQCLETTVTA